MHHKIFKNIYYFVYIVILRLVIDREICKKYIRTNVCLYYESITSTSRYIICAIFCVPR